MEKYSLLLKGLKKETPNEVFLQDLEGPRPITGDTIDPIGFKRLLENIAVKEESYKYVSNFAYSKFKSRNNIISYCKQDLILRIYFQEHKSL